MDHGDQLVRPPIRPIDLPGRGRIGAVMILLYRSETVKAPGFVLTVRRDDLKHHPGQISLPGGSRENDEPLEQTASRETEEEIGVAAEQIEILGSLNNVYIPPSDFTIFPFVGWYFGLPKFTAQESEVAEVIQTDLNWLCQPGAVQFGEISGSAKDSSQAIQSHYFELDSHQVWGATAKVLMDLRARLLRLVQTSNLRCKNRFISVFRWHECPKP